MSIPQYGLLVVAAVLGGALNSVAGGGSFLTFPSLVFAGVPPVPANATNTLALWPASPAAAFAYRHELKQARSWLYGLSAISAIGGFVGALLLLRTPNPVFMRLLPGLMLVAALIFSAGGRLSEHVRGLSSRLPGGHTATLVLGGVVQLVIAAYGGYFGGGIGIMMLAAFSALGMTDIHVMNALKSSLATLINLVAIVVFVVKGAIVLEPALIMVVAATLGGYFGARTARKVDPKWVRRFVLVVAWTMTAYFAWRAYS